MGLQHDGEPVLRQGLRDGPVTAFLIVWGVNVLLVVLAVLGYRWAARQEQKSRERMSELQAETEDLFRKLSEYR